ncbi:MAG TPA: HEAT repeat domain-containing protein, partial [Vicinamibacterales bacterium]
SVTATDGTVQVLFPSNPAVCGDGQSYIRKLGRSGEGQTFVGTNVFSGRDSWSNRPCVSGQGRALATVINGEVTRLSLFVGPVPSQASGTRTLTANAADAATWLGSLTDAPESRVVSQAIQGLMFIDAPAPWPLLLRIARDTRRTRGVRQSALTWLSFGVVDKLGLSDVDEHGSDNDEMRAQAVFVLSQRPKNESVPQLVEIVRTAKNAVARKTAIFWLSQSGDPRAVELYAELLGLR